MITEISDRCSLKMVNPPDKLLALLKEVGNKIFKQDKRINIRLSNHDLLGIQRKEDQKGLSYQAFISGLINQYVEDDLFEESQLKYGKN